MEIRGSSFAEAFKAMGSMDLEAGTNGRMLPTMQQSSVFGESRHLTTNTLPMTRLQLLTRKKERPTDVD